MISHFIAEALATPWALQPERMAAYAAVLAGRYFGRMRAADHRDDTQYDEAGNPMPKTSSPPQAARPSGRQNGAIAVVPVYGPITQRATMMSMCDGGTSTQAISKAMRDANADETVSSIILDIDSPGGSVYGVAELAAEIRASAKPVTAVANSLAASAAYWLGSAASEFYVTPGGEVGSIGVWMAHEDWSKALADAGVATTLISAGKFKTEGNPYGPLDTEARDFMQSRVDDYYGAFTRDVAKGRNASVDDVRNGMGQGRVLGASQAKSAGMVDGVLTFDQVVRHVARSLQPKGRSAQEQRRQRLALLALE
jgi:signal peptide peptidase SppA